MGLPPLNEFNPTKCSQCESIDIVKTAEEPRGPIVMSMANTEYKQTPGDIATQTWQCSACGREWVAVETYPPSHARTD
jgi:hypothetical protein